MKVLLIGSSGMLGQAIHLIFKKNGIDIVTVARTSSEYKIDLLNDTDALLEIVRIEKPEIVINSAAIVSLEDCEENPEKSYMLNGRIPGLLASVCSEIESYFVQISTDHYYKDDCRVLHDETSPILLLNEYARTKYIGEKMALINKNTLVVRTNIVGFRNKTGSPTFVEWIFQMLERNESINGFDDFYTSSIDVYHFANILLELIEKRVTGIINIASKDVLSKYEFIKKIACEISKEQLVNRSLLTKNGNVKRANSLGLDTTRLESIITKNYVPNSDEVINLLIKKYREGAMYAL